MNSDLMNLLSAIGKTQFPNTPSGNQMSQMQQQNPSGFLMGMNNLGMNPNMSQRGPQYQQPSWMDLLGQTMMMGNMMPQMQPYNSYAASPYGSMTSNQPQLNESNWWQKGLQGSGALLSGLSMPLIGAGAGATGTIAGAPLGAVLGGTGIAAGGLGSLFNYLGHPGYQS